MVTKKITVGGTGIKLSHDADVEKLLDRKGVQCLVDSDGDEIFGFESLEDGGTYTLGPPKQQQQQQLITGRPPLAFYGLSFDYKNPHASSGKPHIHYGLEDFPLKRIKPFVPERLDVPLERYFHVLREYDQGIIYYSRELHLQIKIEQLISDVIRSCKYDLRTDTESSLNGLKVDIGVLHNSNRQICGTTEVKQPFRPNHRPADAEPMTHPKVVAQVASQMIPLRTLYGLQEVYGILTTYKEWRFFKYELEEGDEAITKINDLKLSDPQDNSQVVDTNPLKTPQKSARPRRTSPPMSPKPCTEEECHAEEEVENEKTLAAALTAPLKRGTLYVSDVVPAGRPALEMLAWILKKMSESKVTPVKPHEREFLYVVRKGDTLGGYERLRHSRDEYKGRMPNSSNTKLYLLETLGHGDHGRVYRAMSKNLNLCVLKFFVTNQDALDTSGAQTELSSGQAARKAADYWNKAYEGWLPQATYGKWGGGDAIVMPDLEKMSIAVHAEEVMGKLECTMQSRFYDKGIWHGDPAWRNVALVRDAHANITKVCMIDLEPERMMELSANDSAWKQDFSAMWKEFKTNLEHNWKDFVEGEMSSM